MPLTLTCYEIDQLDSGEARSMCDGLDGIERTGTGMYRGTEVLVPRTSTAVALELELTDRPNFEPSL